MSKTFFAKDKWSLVFLINVIENYEQEEAHCSSYLVKISRYRVDWKTSKFISPNLTASLLDETHAKNCLAHPLNSTRDSVGAYIILFNFIATPAFFDLFKWQNARKKIWIYSIYPTSSFSDENDKKHYWELHLYPTRYF